MAVGQVDVSAVNKPIELLNEANTDIEDGNYKDAVQKLIAANRLNPKLTGGLLVLEYGLYSHEPDFFAEGVSCERKGDI